MSHVLPNDREFFREDRIPAGFFLSDNEEGNLSILFDGPQMIRRAVAPETKRRLALAPAIGAAIVGIAIWFGASVNLQSDAPTQAARGFDAPVRTASN